MSLTNNTVKLGKAGWQDWGWLKCSEIVASWAINEAGQFSGFLPRSDVINLDNQDVRGHWVEWEHPTAGRWGGKITNQRWTLDRQALEIAAETFHCLVRRRRTAASYKRMAGPAGSLFSRALRDAATEDTLYLNSIMADEVGDPITLEWRGEDIYESVLPSLVDASGQEWEIDADRNARWVVRLGSDKRGQVYLSDGRHIVEGSYEVPLWNIENDLIGIGGDGSFATATTAQAEDRDSIARYGRLQGSRIYPNLQTKAAILASLHKAIHHHHEPIPSDHAHGTGEFSVVDVDYCWSRFSEGDLVKVALAASNAWLDFRVRARSVDTTSGVMLVSGDVGAEVRP